MKHLRTAGAQTIIVPRRKHIKATARLKLMLKWRSSRVYKKIIHGCLRAAVGRLFLALVFTLSRTMTRKLKWKKKEREKQRQRLLLCLRYKEMRQ